MMRRLVPLAVLLLAATPASAHKLKLFATVAGDAVSGYAFFVGGGRPQGSAWVAKDAAGTTIAEGSTDAEGGFAFTLPSSVASDVTITVDTHEAHIASATLAAGRLRPVDADPAVLPAGAVAAQAAGDGALAALVAEAVQREMAPLEERLEAMDSRLRFVDILSGVFLIIGLAGIGLWARARRR